MYKQVEIFTDGSCLGNPGPGGYAVIIRFLQHIKVLSAGYYFTTNNRMELMAIIISIQTLKRPCYLVISTDSKYVQQGITQWIYNWKKRNWKINKKNIKNIDLWKKLDLIVNQHKIDWKWIKGHSGHLENKYCDKLARIAALKPTLNDIGYLS